ncbi:MAG TPA: hypothetical protein VF939_19280 [Puia sp.]
MKLPRFLSGIKPSLLTLTIEGIAVGMTEFMMMGVLPDVAKSLSVSIPSAGHLISIYALGVVIGAPLMTEVAHFSGNMVTIIMIIAGLGMAAGNFAGGKLADRYSPLKTTANLLLSMIGALLIVSWVSAYQVPEILMTFITGGIAFAIIAPLQMLMIKAASGAEMLASSSIQASANMGNALGAYLGGLPIRQDMVTVLPSLWEQDWLLADLSSAWY